MNEQILAGKRRAIESLYDSTCNIYEYGRFKDEDGITQTGLNPVPTYENQACRLSFESVKPTNQTETVAKIAQSIKLFIAPELNIKPNSKIIITRLGKTIAYSFSSVPAIYSSHQEISLNLYEDEA